jgi:hypothetical protein
MRRKWIVTSLIALPLLVFACVAAVVKTRVPTTRYKFLHGAEMLMSERAFSGKGPAKTIVNYAVYNIRRPYPDVANEIENELKPDGWKSVRIGVAREAAWTKSSAGSGRTSKNTAGAACGKAEILPAGTSPSLSSRAVEGWTAVFVIEEYKPNWLDNIIDRFRGPVSQQIEDLSIYVIPGRDKFPAKP